MMKRFKLRVVGILLVMLMTGVVCLTGCTPETETPGETAASVVTEASSTPQGTTAPAETTVIGMNFCRIYKPSKAFDEDGNEVALTEIFGSAYTTYGGSLELSEDKTFKLTIGIDKGDGVGTYQLISSDELKFSYDNGKTSTVKITEIDENIAKELAVPYGEFTIMFV